MPGNHIGAVVLRLLGRNAGGVGIFCAIAMNACSGGSGPGVASDGGRDAATATGKRDGGVGAAGAAADSGTGFVGSGGSAGAATCSVGTATVIADASVFSGSASAPPPNCVPPCLWELMKDCLPEGLCTSEVLDPLTSYSGQMVECTFGNQWRRDYRNGHDSADFSVYLRGRLCWSASGYLIPPTVAKTWKWTDAVGRIVAIGQDARTDAGVWTTSITCASSAAGQGGTFVIDPTLRGCAPWGDLAVYGESGVTCGAGCCPRGGDPVR